MVSPTSDPIDVRELRGVKFSMDVKNPQAMTSGADQADQGAMTAGSAPAGGTGATAGAYDTAANRDTMITAQNALRDDVIALDKLLTEIRTTLVNNGMIKGSA